MLCRSLIMSKVVFSAHEHFQLGARDSLNDYVGRSVHWSVPLAFMVGVCINAPALVLGSTLFSRGPEGVDDLCFHACGEFSPPPPSLSPSPPSYPPLPPTLRPISQPRGPYPSLEAQIPVLRSKSLEYGIWAMGLGLGP